MCDQLTVQVCEHLTLDELIALESLQLKRGIIKRSTIAAFLKDTMDGNNPRAKAADKIKALCALMRCGYGEFPMPIGTRKLTSKDLLRLGYGCSHPAD